MSHIIRSIPMTGFDGKGEPQIRVLDDGMLQVVFNFMPPSDVSVRDLVHPYQDFDKQMAHAIGVEVIWEDRELFLIDSPQADTVPRLMAFVSGFRSGSNAVGKGQSGAKGTCFERNCPDEHPFSTGQRVTHAKFGDGVVINYDFHGNDARVQVRFQTGGEKWLALEFAKLKTI